MIEWAGRGLGNTVGTGVASFAIWTKSGESVSYVQVGDRPIDNRDTGVFTRLFWLAFDGRRIENGGAIRKNFARSVECVFCNHAIVYRWLYRQFKPVDRRRDSGVGYNPGHSTARADRNRICPCIPRDPCATAKQGKRKTRTRFAAHRIRIEIQRSAKRPHSRLGLRFDRSDLMQIDARVIERNEWSGGDPGVQRHV